MTITDVVGNMDKDIHVFVASEGEILFDGSVKDLVDVMESNPEENDAYIFDKMTTSTDENGNLVFIDIKVINREPL